MLWKDSLAAPCRGWDRAGLAGPAACTGFMYMGSAPKGRPVPCWDLRFGGAMLGPGPCPPPWPGPLHPWALGRASPGAAPSLAQFLSAGVFLATSNEALQPSACPLVFAALIHRPPAPWEGLWPRGLEAPGRGQDPLALTSPLCSSPFAASAPHRRPGTEALQRGPRGDGRLCLGVGG